MKKEIPQKVWCPHNGQVLGCHASGVAVQGDTVQVPDQAGQRAVVGFRQAPQHLPQLAASFVILVRRLDCRHKTIIKGEGANGVGQLAEVHLEQGGH